MRFVCLVVRFISLKPTEAIWINRGIWRFPSNPASRIHTGLLHGNLCFTQSLSRVSTLYSNETDKRQNCHCEGKGTPKRRESPRGGEVEVYLYTLLTSALKGVGGQHHAPAALSPGKTRYPLHRRLGGPQGRSGRVRKISPLSGLDPRTVQPVTSRYTDWAIPAPKIVTVPN
jgi:hypothetical protein